MKSYKGIWVLRIYKPILLCLIWLNYSSRKDSLIKQRNLVSSYWKFEKEQ